MQKPANSSGSGSTMRQMVDHLIGKPQISGLTLSSLRKNYSIAPIFVLMTTGIIFAGTAIAHTLKNPEVSLHRRNNPEPWNDYEHKQYKFFAFGRDYSNVECPAPTYK